jgi:hypothetical protein
MKIFRFLFLTRSQKDLAVLRQAGFDAQEISSFCQLREKYQANMRDQPSVPQNHLLFTRWLVQKGRLNEGEQEK